jgi:hypothetical protein
MIDTWDPATKTLLKSFPPKPNAYFAYGLISRLTAKHSTLVATVVAGGQINGTNRVFAAALRSPKGQNTWIIVNDAPCAWPAQLQISGGTRARLFRYQVTPQQKDNANLKVMPVPKVRLKAGAATFGDELPPMSLTIYSTYNLSPTDKGIIAE